MKLPTLFSRTSTNAIQTWTIEIDKGRYRTEHGQLDGAIQQTQWTVVKPTNEGRANARDVNEQAIFEARAKWDKRKKHGYFEDINDVDQEIYVEPMLAKRFFDRKDEVTYPCIVQCKYNGGRCIATRHGLFTRKGEIYISVPHVEESLKEFFVKWPNAILDGELMGEGLKEKLNETMKLIRKKVKVSATDLFRSEKLVRFWVYDGYNFDGITKSDDYRVRAAGVKKVLHDVKYYREVESYLCTNEEEVYQQYNKLVDDNEEGAIIRLLGKPYENKRSSNLLKMKPEDDDEGVITDIVEGEGNWAGTGKRIFIKWHNEVIVATFKGSKEQGAKFLKEKNKWIGKTVTFLYNGFTGLGTPNYARMDINNCLKS